MGFRRKKTGGLWRRFTQIHAFRFADAGLPGALLEDQHAFDLFLMHGACASPYPVDVDFLSFAQREALVELAVHYLSRFEDPGLGLFKTDVQDQIVERASALKGESAIDL